MIEDFISRSLILAFGYAYPAFQCFKTLEKNRVGIQELRFWCQYWVIVAVLTVLEKFLDIFISWLPLYKGLKLIVFIYLWHPSTKGSSYIYETFLQPYVARHETDIDRTIAELKERAWNLASNYWCNCADLSSKKFLECFQFVLSQFLTIAQARHKTAEIHQQTNEAPTPQQPNEAPTPPSTPSGIFRRNVSEKRRPPIPPSGSSPLHRSLTPKSESFNKIKLRNQTQFIHAEDIPIPDSDRPSASEDKSESDHELHAARVKLRPVKSGKM